MTSTAGDIARVLVDVGLSHLDRPFDYLVPEIMSAKAMPGVRVRVRFAGRLVDGFVLSRESETAHKGRLSPLSSVVSSEVVLRDDVLELCRAVAERYSSTLADVIRFAVPPRHARAEAAPDVARDDLWEVPEVGPWGDYVGGAALVERIADGKSCPRAAIGMLPSRDPFAEILVLVRAALASGGGVLILVPDARDVVRVTTAADLALGKGVAVALTADLGPQRRYRAFLDVLRGNARVVVGTRAAAFAPVAHLRLMVCWDDGDDLYSSPQFPYWHAREVLALRSHLHSVPLVLAGYARTPEVQVLVDSGWAKAVLPRRPALRAVAPRVTPSGGDFDRERDPAATAARIPHNAWTTAHAALASGPVLVQVPFAGYARGLACGTCRSPMRCVSCSGPLQIPSTEQAPACVWCGARAVTHACSTCGGTAVRAQVIGSARTVEELGRAFPGARVIRSDGEHVVSWVDSTPALVIATTGAEPQAEGGYAAVLLLDARALLERPGLRAGEEALRRWCNAAALARPGAPVVVTAEQAIPAVQALMRWDPVWFSSRELAERAHLGLPPAVRMAALTGDQVAVAEMLSIATLPSGARVLGPVPAPRREAPDTVRALLSVTRREGMALARALHDAQAIRSAHRSPGSVEVRVDPMEIG